MTLAYVSLEAIAQANVPVLLPDTCILLDLLRSPRRENVDGNAMLAGNGLCSLKSPNMQLRAS